jgi:hypothetical protein
VERRVREAEEGEGVRGREGGGGRGRREKRVGRKGTGGGKKGRGRGGINGKGTYFVDENGGDVHKASKQLRHHLSPILRMQLKALSKKKTKTSQT